MYDKLTENDIKKMQEEIDYRKLVVRPKELEAVVPFFPLISSQR